MPKKNIMNWKEVPTMNSINEAEIMADMFSGAMQHTLEASQFQIQSP